MTKNLLSARNVPRLLLIAISIGGLTGCSAHYGVRSGGNGGTSGGNAHHGNGVQNPRNHRVDSDTESDHGYVAAGEAPEDGTNNAALAEPSISGPHQWPLNVATKEEFHPDPKDIISVTVEPDPVSKNKLITTIKVRGQKNKYPGQEH